MRRISTQPLAWQLAFAVVLACSLEVASAQQKPATLAPAQLGTLQTAANQAAKKQPCQNSPEFRQFDFWIGDWNVENPQGQLVGTNTVQLILGDCVLFENWTGGGGGSGKSFNVYNSTTGKWQQTWVDDKGNILELAGEFKDGVMRLAGESPAGNAGKLMNRLMFTKISADRVRQLWEQSADGGKTWTVAFDGMYLRKK